MLLSLPRLRGRVLCRALLRPPACVLNSALLLHWPNPQQTRTSRPPARQWPTRCVCCVRHLQRAGPRKWPL